MFPPIFPFYISGLMPLHKYATLVWFAGIVFLWLTRYTHQFGRRWGAIYYTLSVLLRPLGILFIAVGWLALYSPDMLSYMSSMGFGWLPSGTAVDYFCWLAILLFFALGVWSVVVLGLRRSFFFRRFDDPLIRRGPYALVRHPQFLSVIGVIFFSIRLFNPNAYTFMAYGALDLNWALFSLSLWVLAILEDRELAAHFGTEYEDYTRSVSRLLPN